MENLVYLFPFIFIGIWMSTIYILSKMGWGKLAAHYKTNCKFVGKRVGIISASINNINYENSLILKYNSEGFFIKPIFIFCSFHDPIFIPWEDIKEIRDKQFLFLDLKN